MPLFCMINQHHFREYVVKPVLIDAKLYSRNIEELLIATMAHESLGGYYLKQINGLALGVYQIEPATYYDLWENYLKYRPEFKLTVYEAFNVNSMPSPNRLISDLTFSTLIARLIYLRAPQPLPDYQDLEGIWEYYKRYWNTEKGKATKDEFMKNYREYVNAT